MSNKDATNYDNCLVVSHARMLAKEIAKLEDDLEIEDYPHQGMAIASIRHTCTNYDDLLEELGSSYYALKCFQKGTCTFNDPDGIEKCPAEMEAYFVIRSAADELAEKLLLEHRDTTDKTKGKVTDDR